MDKHKSENSHELMFAYYLPNPYSMGWNMPECRSTKMCKHSERPQGSSIGITSVGKAVSMNAEINKHD